MEQNKKLNYPLSSLTLEDIISINEKIQYCCQEEEKKNANDKNEGLVSCFQEEIDDNEKQMIESSIAYIKFIALVISNYKGDDIYSYVNNTITKIGRFIIDSIIELQKANSTELLETLEMEKDSEEVMLLDKIIIGYEKEYNVVISSKDDKKYEVLRDKEPFSINLETQKVYSLVNKG